MKSLFRRLFRRWFNHPPRNEPSAGLDTRPARPPQERTTLVATISDLDCGVLVRIEGEAGIVGLEMLQFAFARLMARRPHLAILDLSQLTFLSSLAMGQLVRLHRDLNRWNGRVKIARCPAAIGEALDVAGLLGFFEFHATVEEALGRADAVGGFSVSRVAPLGDGRGQSRLRESFVRLADACEPGFLWLPFFV
jgi:anti-anti-sigma factor